MDSSHSSIDLKSSKSNATPHIHIVTIYCWDVSPITMEIDVRLVTYLIEIVLAPCDVKFSHL